MSENKGSFPTRSTLVGSKIYLQPASAEKVANTYHWYLQSNPEMLSCYPQPFQSAAEAAAAYQKETRTTDCQLFMIVSQKEKSPVGWIRFFNYNSLNRSAELEILVDPDERRNGHALGAIRLLADFLFRVRGLNKVSIQISSLNTAAVKLLAKAGFQKEGTLRHHYFYQGELHPGYIYSLLLVDFER